MRSRSEDWSPVGFATDPTPGDRELVDALILHLRKWSERLTRQATVATNVLDTNFGASSWTGLAADAVSKRLRALSEGAQKAAGQHTAGVEAATTWSASLVVAQSNADVALQDAERASADLAAAEASVTALGLQHEALVSALRELQKAYNSSEKVPPGSSAPAAVDVANARGKEQEKGAYLAHARRTVESAQERLDDAKRRAERAKDDFETAERTFADALDQTLSGAVDPMPQNELGAFTALVGKLSTIPASASVNASLMSTLTQLTPEELAVWLAQDPDLAQQFWGHPPSPDRVAAWWSSLRDETRAAFEAAAPGVLGNLAGLPYAVRSRCNLAVYKEAQSQKHRLTPEQQRVLTALKKVLGDPTASLVCLNLDAPVPMVAVGYGDLDTADTVTWAAPGMNSDAADATAGWSRAVKNLYLQQNELDGGRSHAVVAWLGYNTPGLDSVSFAAMAQDGAWRFANELDGTHATRAAHPEVSFLHVSAVAHSYGTTMAADALMHTRCEVDSFTMLGSAGIDTTVVTSLSALHVKQLGGVPAIYTTWASEDHLAPFGTSVGLSRSAPSSMGGAQSFSSEGAVLPDGMVLNQTKGHNPLGESAGGNDLFNTVPPAGHCYFDEHTESLRNSGYTTVGLPGKVVGGLRSTG